ncbi:MAG TPA: UvrD-helicase domain-containing protein [Firmicutes bacterium]|nr:UvrD-helicase domain-containing protein [Bacillota bacterium]
MQQLLAQLNEQQREAVQHGSGPLLILAGAGSGKTKVLTHRIAYLLAQGVQPRQILAITFTNKAAWEMRERVRALVGEREVAGIWIMTFHAACARILRQEGRYLGYRPGFVIYDKGDQLALIRSVLRGLNLDEKYYSPQGTLAVISRAKNELVDPAGFLPYLQRYSHYSDVYARRLLDIYTQYQEKLRENNALDFDDLLAAVVRLFGEYPQVLQRYRERFRYILVDEYQDTNHAQYVLIKLLATEEGNLLVVGDDYQSIYGFRGADLRNILDFERDYRKVKIIKLEQNYRSNGSVLAAANGLMAYNIHQKPKSLWTARGAGEKVKVYRALDERDEAAYVAGEISQLAAQGFSWRDFAVLYRTNAQSRVLEEVFRNQGIPYKLVGTLGFYDRKEIKDLVAYLRLLVNPDDGIALRRIINIPKRGIGPATFNRIEVYARARNLPLVEILALAEEIPGLSQKVRTGLIQLAEVLQTLQGLAREMPVTALIPQILALTGYEKELEWEGTAKAQERLENLREFITVAGEFEARGESNSLEDFLTGVSLLSDADTYQEGEDAAVMMTLHSAKGLEFPVVFLVGMEEGLLPHSRSLEREEDVEEERRLCYVGITRAQQKLYLVCARERTLYGYRQSNPVSRFIKEIPAEVKEAVGEKGRAQEGPDAGLWEHHSIPPGGAAAPAPFTAGDKVRHRAWGEGTVISISGQGEDALVTVAFPDRGIKTLSLLYAPLVKV